MSKSGLLVGTLTSFLLPVFLYTMLAPVSAAPLKRAPLKLTNKLVVTGGREAYIIDPDGRNCQEVWQAPKGYGNFGGFSPDGRFAISYNGFNLYIHNLKTGHFRRLLLWAGGFGSTINSPSFSPDGKQVICSVNSATNSVEYSRVLCMNINQTYSVKKEKSIERAYLKPTNEARFEDVRQPRWSADGKRIIAIAGYLDLASNGESLEVWTMNKNDKAGKTGQRLTNDRFWDEYPAWNAQQTQVAFIRHYTDEAKDYVATHGRNLYVMNADGSGQHALTQNEKGPDTFIRLSNPLFSRSGKQIAFNQENSVFIINIEGTGLRKVTDGELLQWVW